MSMLWRVLIATILPASMVGAHPVSTGALQTTATVVRSFASTEVALPTQAGVLIPASEDFVIIADQGVELAYDGARRRYLATSTDHAGASFVTVIYP